MSLRDQLLKAGLANKKQAKKAAKAAKKQQHDKLKHSSEQNSSQTPSDAISEAIEQQQLERKIKDQALNRKIVEERENREHLYRASEIIVSRDFMDQRPNYTPYYFLVQKTVIKHIYASDLQHSKLASGEYGIATTGPENFYLLRRADCEIVRQIHPKFIACLHDIESKV